ncbi:antitoxin VbhA family protein [Bacillus cereus]|nr:antitoxin VbhA family protein [Bacillus cereus]
MKWTDRKLQEAMANVEASLAVEGLYVTEEDRSLILASIKGEITHEEFLRLAKERAMRAGEMPDNL